MNEKEEICEKIKSIYEGWFRNHHDGYVSPDRYIAWKKTAEAERDELCERIRKL